MPMAKRFRLRISRVIPSFQSCRSKDPSTLPANPVPSFLRPSPPLVNNKLMMINQSHFPFTATPKQPSATSKTHHHSSIKRHVSSAFQSVGCGFGSRPTLSDDDRSESPPPDHQFQWEREDRWHVVAKVHDNNKTPRRKIYTSSNDDVSVSSPPPKAEKKKKKKKRRVKNRKMTSRMIRISTSSAESGLFSSSEAGFDDDEDDILETETLVSSSRSFSTDTSSSDLLFNPQHLETIREHTPDANVPSRRSKKKMRSRAAKKAKRSVSRKSESDVDEMLVPARLSVFQRLIPCTVEGKVRESFAVVKRSEDPYEDFKRSMMEMILEKQMFEEEDLEQLLHCFLSLNSRHHHAVIVQAFSEIWEGLFSATRSSGPRLSRPL